MSIRFKLIVRHKWAHTINDCQQGWQTSTHVGERRRRETGHDGAWRRGRSLAFGRAPPGACRHRRVHCDVERACGTPAFVRRVFGPPDAARLHARRAVAPLRRAASGCRRDDGGQTVVPGRPRRFVGVRPQEHPARAQPDHVHVLPRFGAQRVCAPGRPGRLWAVAVCGRRGLFARAARRAHRAQQDRPAGDLDGRARAGDSRRTNRRQPERVVRRRGACSSSRSNGPSCPTFPSRACRAIGRTTMPDAS